MPGSLETPSHNDIPFSRPASPGGLPALQVGFVGLGNIGYAMAKNLAVNGPEHVRNLPPVKVWNRTRSKAEKLVEFVGQDKATIAESVEQVANECDVIVVNVANDDVVRIIYAQFKEALTVRIYLPSDETYADFLYTRPTHQQRTRSSWRRARSEQRATIPSSSLNAVQIYPSLAGELDHLLSTFPHTHLITCPVLGSSLVADQAKLMLIMSGDYPSKKLVANIFVPSIGRRVIDLGGDLEKGLQ